MFAKRHGPLVVTFTTLALAACGTLEAEPPPDVEQCVPALVPPAVFVAPTVQCLDGSAQAYVEFSSANGQSSYAPFGDQCVLIYDASGAPVAPYTAPGDPYLTPIYTSPPLTLSPGASYTVEIVTCSTGLHAHPGNAGFPWSNATVTAPTCDAGSGKGMTWGRYRVEPITGVLQVGCQPPDGLGDCDAYHGDTSCSTELPVLCKRALGLPQPATFTWPPDATHVWSGNVVATTPPIAPATAGLTTRAAANAYCASQFGAGWEVAEHHDGWGWNFTAYGNLGTSPRFWVDILDQPDATCW